MIEIMPGHSLWEPAGTLYDAWRRAAGLQALMAPSWDELPDHSRKPWLLVAQAAKDTYGEYQDDLMAVLDRTHATVRKMVSAEQWEQILRALNKVAEPGTPSHLIADDEISAESRPIVGGPVRLTGLASAFEDMTNSLGGDPHAHARITALQRQVAFQLTQLWKMVASEVAHSRPSPTAVTDYHNSVWGQLKEADNQVAEQFYGDPEEITHAQ